MRIQLRKKQVRRRRGFTLMEVLLVLAILVILGSLVTVGYFKIQQNANFDMAKNQIRSLGTAVDAYQLHVGSFPNGDQGLDALRIAPPDVPQGKWRGPYIDKELPLDPWGRAYIYELAQTPNGDPSYKISSNGQDGQQGTADDVFLPQ